MMLDKRFLNELPFRKARLYTDTRLDDTALVDDFAFEWRRIDPYPDLELLSYGHLFGRFLLPRSFFRDKVVVDLGCGNGRLARFFIHEVRGYIGIELSDAILAFEVPAEDAGKVRLVRASVEDAPVLDRVADVVLCWGVLHHVRSPEAAIREMRRLVKPGGMILLYVYPDAFAPRENLNRLLRHVDPANFLDFCAWFLSTVRRWGELDGYLSRELCRALSVSIKLHARWELFQMFDGLGPAHHHLLEKTLTAAFEHPWRRATTAPGCTVIAAPTGPDAGVSAAGE